MNVKLFTLLFLLSLSTKARHFLDTNKIWSVLECATGGGTSCGTIKYKLVEDTVINGVNYYEVYASYDSTGVNWFPLQHILSEDTTNKKVYIDNLLLYDFMLNKGDTVQTAGPYGSPFCLPFIVDSVDTFVYSGSARRRILFENNVSQYTTTWIEGLGSTDGIIHSFIRYCMVDADANLLCCDSAGIQIYQSPYFASCYLILNSNEQDKLASAKISPNPFYDQIKINFPESSEKDIYLKIFNTSGDIVFENTVRMIDQEIILPSLACGLYYISFQNDKKYLVEKLVKIY